MEILKDKKLKMMAAIFILLMSLILSGCSSNDIIYSKKDKLNLAGDLIGAKGDITVNYTEKFVLIPSDEKNIHMIENVMEYTMTGEGLTDESIQTFTNIVEANFNKTFKSEGVSFEKNINGKVITMSIKVDLSKVDLKAIDLSSMGLYEQYLNKDKSYPLNKMETFLINMGFER